MEQEQNKQSRQTIAKKYHAIHNKLFLMGIIITFSLLIIAIVGGNKGISGHIVAIIGGKIANIWLLIGIYVAFISIAYSIISLPLNFYEGYILEHKFNLSTQTVSSWIKDQLKSFAISLIISLIIIETTYFLLRQAGNFWWIWAGILWIFFTIILSRLAPIILLPIFYKLTPLKDEDLINRLQALAQKVKSNILGIFEIDLSRKTKKANAAFTGWGKSKRILLSDTLLKDFSAEEIEVILAHELAHYHYKHIWKLLFLGVVSTFIGLWMADIILNATVIKLGFTGISDIAAFPLFALVLFIFTLFSLPINNTLSRILEHQADKMAIELTNNPQAFIDSMNKLAEQNLADRTPNPIIHFLLHNHPSISERVKMGRDFL